MRRIDRQRIPAAAGDFAAADRSDAITLNGSHFDSLRSRLSRYG
jgi:hypothetical protein